MRITTITTCLILPTALVTQGQEKKSHQLPRKSAELVKKLGEYEAEKIAELEKDLTRVRTQVITSLKKHLEAATKSGKLEDAIAIRDKIQELEAKIPKPGEKKKPASNLFAKDYTFKLESNGPRWTKSKVQVRKGQKVTVSATGKNDLSKDFATDIGPEGTPNRFWGFNNKFDSGSLLCRISEDNDNTICIGKKKTFTAQVDGELEFTVNDRYLGDNSGAFQLKITVK